MAQCTIEFAQLPRSRRISRSHEGGCYLVDVDGSLFARRAADVVDVLIMHYGEEPSAEIRARLPEIELLPARGRACPVRDHPPDC